MLCATQCPPHASDVPHEVSYFPHHHASIFATKDSVCAWLSDGLQTHSLNCRAQTRLLSHITVTTNGEFSSVTDSSYFHFFLDGVHFSLPFVYVECAMFSFCRLHRQHDLLVSKVGSPCKKFDLWMSSSENCGGRTYLAASRQKQLFVSLSVRLLNDVKNSLQMTTQRRKSDFVDVLLNDFFDQ